MCVYIYIWVYHYGRDCVRFDLAWGDIETVIIMIYPLNKQEVFSCYIVPPHNSKKMYSKNV